jgi:hypothetical protein
MSVLTRNLAALAVRSPNTAEALSDTAPGGLAVESARSGDPTARLLGDEGPGPYVHSRFDPRTDGARRAAAVSPATGYVLALGPGLFYEVEALLAREALAVVLVVEPQPGLLRAALEARDVSALLEDPRVMVATGKEALPKALSSRVSRSYLPLLHGAFRIEVPRAREGEEAITDAARAAGDAARAQLDDLAVQRRFGRRWLSHAVRNLATAPAGDVDLPSIDTVAVAAAGPSLEKHLAELDGATSVIATDTALPALTERGLRPLLVVALDCQQVSYHHLLTAFAPGTTPNPRTVPMIADLSAPPSLLRRAGPVALGLTDYPLAGLLARRFDGLPSLPGTGGNVTQAAVSIAAGLGARRIHLLGADLSYPAGAPYARDTYVYPYFRSRATRLEPVQSRLFDMVLADPQTRGRREDAGLRYVPPKLETYRGNLEAFVDELDTDVIFGPGGRGPAPGRGPASGRGSEGAGRRSLGRRLSVPPLEERLAWLREYARAVAEAELPAGAGAAALAALSEAEREIWYTLMPTAASFTEGELDVGRARLALEASRRWVSDRLSRVLGRYAANPTPP